MADDIVQRMIEARDRRYLREQAEWIANGFTFCPWCSANAIDVVTSPATADFDLSMLEGAPLREHVDRCLTERAPIPMKAEYENAERIIAAARGILRG